MTFKGHSTLSTIAHMISYYLSIAMYYGPILYHFPHYDQIFVETRDIYIPHLYCICIRHMAAEKQLKFERCKTKKHDAVQRVTPSEFREGVQQATGKTRMIGLPLRPLASVYKSSDVRYRALHCSLYETATLQCFFSSVNVESSRIADDWPAFILAAY